MSTLATTATAMKAWCDDDNLWLLLTDGRQLSVPLSYFPRLRHATAKQRAKVQMSGGGAGLHWPHLDEDISVAGLLLGQGDRRRPASPKTTSRRQR
jgi:hypothetical protein